MCSATTDAGGSAGCCGPRRTEGAGARGRSTVCGEVHVPAGADPETTSAYAFARAVGFETVHLEDHLVLRLPEAEEDLERLRGRVRGRAEGYDVVTWGNRCPDAYVAAYCAMKSQMSTDVPTGDIDYQPIVYDEARLRSQEERTARSYDQLVAAVRRPDGAFAGYTQMFLSRDDDIAIQDDTLVMPGTGIPARARSSSSRRLRKNIVLRDHSGRRSIHTWTDPENHAMYRTNTDFGFRPVERLHEMQRIDPPLVTPRR